MKHELPELPYGKDALAPVMGAETIEYHYGKHERGYIDTLNKLIDGTEYAELPLEDVVRRSEGVLFNNAAQAWNHLFFFWTFSPKPKLAPDGALKEAIDRQFGSLDAFKAEFEKAGATLFGSGWVWLSRAEDGSLVITQGKNAENPLTQKGLVPLLGVDVWEHAYYLDYRNRRPEYLHSLWQIIDWSVVEKRFA